MASTLPQDVWALILQHLPVADRLQHCALVCKKLSRAAAEATDALRVALRRGIQEQRQLAEAFDSYLQHHGSHVTSLVLGNGGQALTQLPCPRMLHLEISGADAVQLGLPGVLDSATGLTNLKLSYCTVTPDGSLSRLSVLVDLQHLHVEYVRPPGGRHVSLPGSVLPSLSHLTHIQLSGAAVENVHHVSGLTKLSVLRIQHVDRSRPVRLAHDIAPGFVLPASLQELSLGSGGVVLDPAVLTAATQLTFVGLWDLTVKGPGGGVSSGAALLAAVAGLQQLDTLELSHLKGIAWPAPSAAYAALTASSKLQRLEVRDCDLLPVIVWEHVFPPARCCPALREFAVDEGDADGAGYWSAEAVSSLVRCCPGLQDLELRLSGAPAVAALKPLIELTRLNFWVDLPEQSVDLPDVRASVQHVAALTNLHRLQLHLLIEDGEDADADGCTAALLPLTSLRQLTVCNVDLTEGLELEDQTYLLVADNQADPEQPPDVWLQVLERCLQASNCQPAVIAVTMGLAQQQAQQQQQQQLGELQQQIGEQQQQIEELQQQNAHLQQQHAQQGPQLQTLRAQVQQLMQHLQL